jgi:hypothetical protein
MRTQQLRNLVAIENVIVGEGLEETGQPNSPSGLCFLRRCRAASEVLGRDEKPFRFLNARIKLGEQLKKSGFSSSANFMTQ